MECIFVCICIYVYIMYICVECVYVRDKFYVPSNFKVKIYSNAVIVYFRCRVPQILYNITNTLKKVFLNVTNNISSWCVQETQLLIKRPQYAGRPINLDPVRVGSHKRCIVITLLRRRMWAVLKLTVIQTVDRRWAHCVTNDFPAYQRKQNVG